MAIDADNARGQLLAVLMEKVRNDPYPSSTMLDLIEALLTPEEAPAYVVFLLDKVREDQYPSMPFIRRLTGLVGP